MNLNRLIIHGVIAPECCRCCIRIFVLFFFCLISTETLSTTTVSQHRPVAPLHHVVSDYLDTRRTLSDTQEKLFRHDTWNLVISGTNKIKINKNMFFSGALTTINTETGQLSDKLRTADLWTQNKSQVFYKSPVLLINFWHCINFNKIASYSDVIYLILHIWLFFCVLFWTVDP